MTIRACLLSRAAPPLLVTLVSAGCGSTNSSGALDGAILGTTESDGGASLTASGDGSTGATPQTDGGVSLGSSTDSSATGNPDGSGPPPVDASGSFATDGAPPAGFWDPSNVGPAKNVMMFKFLNRTNGKCADSAVYWSFKSGAISETHSIAEQSAYDMPANASGRLYFYLCCTADAACTTDPTKSKYFDFIEHTIGAHQYNGNTTRVDAFGIKIAMRLHCADGFEATVGEDYATFQEDRAATFQRFIDAVPQEFKPLAQPPFAPYRIVEPGAGGFNQGGANAHYYDSFVDQLWAANGLTIAKPGPNGSGLAANPNISAAIFRHVGAAPGTFDANGKLLNQKLWATSDTFYAAAPADYYARFWHANALGGKAYGFPYDDVGGYSSYISHANPQYLLVAIGW
jgi:hypothetical protein